MKILIDGENHSLRLKISPDEIENLKYDIPLEDKGFLLYEIFGISELTIELDKEFKYNQKAAA